MAGIQADAASDAATASALRAEYLLYQGLHLRVPQLFATLASLGEGKSFGAAVVLGRLGHSLRLAHRLEQSVRFLEQALATLAQAPEGASRMGLAAMLQRDLGDALLALDRPAAACHAYEAGLAAFKATQDLAGQSALRDRLADAARGAGAPAATAEAAVPAPGPMPESAGFRLTMIDETAVSYVFDSGLLIDGVPESRQATWTPAGGASDGALCPTLVPFARSWTAMCAGWKNHRRSSSGVVLAVGVRRFKCANAGCPRRTFAENIHALAGRYQRRTQSQARALHALGHAPRW